MTDRWIKKILDEDVSLRERLFRIMLCMGMLAMAVATVACCILKENPVIIVFFAIALVLFMISLWSSMRFHKMDTAAIVTWIMVDLIMLPISFFQSGGIESESSVWFVIGIVFAFLLFSGKRFLVFLVLMLAEYMGIYYYAYQQQDLIVPMKSVADVYIDSALAVLIVGLIIGAVIKFQIRVFTKEKELSEKRREEIEQISLSKSAFFANMSHEIRTPINTIIGLNEMILREENSEETAENARHIQSASKMLLALINDILDMSKIESGKMEIVPVQYETGSMFSDLVNLIWLAANEKNLQFNVNIAENIPSMLYGDEVRIKQILINLLTNAVKYTEKGSVTLSAQGQVLGRNRVQLRISVKDTGIGIRKENLDELFTSFKRVDQEKNSKVEGTGLGLSITKQLLELMNGKIEVDSIYTQGSEFTITLEQKIVDESPIGSMDFLLKNNANQNTKYRQSFEAPDARILVVDDNEMNLLVVVKLLRETKIQVDTASSGKMCLDMTRQKHYHLIFMDYKMPDMDGIETLQMVRKQENGFCQEVPIIALTANVMTGADRFYRETGFQGYLAKPINSTLLEAMLMRQLPEELVEYHVQTEEDARYVENMIHMVSERQKKPICITTDCLCDLPTEWLDFYQIRSMYYYVVTDQGKFSDLDEVNSDNLLQYIADENCHVQSEPASVEEYEKFFAEALTEAEQVIHIAMAKGVSDGYVMAKEAAKGFDHVYVVDSGQLSSAMGLMVMHAAVLAKNQYSVDYIVNGLETIRPRIESTFLMASSKHLYQNHRIGKTANTICNLFDMHPVVGMGKDRLRCYRLETGRIERVYIKYIRRQLRHKKKIDKRILFVTYSGCTVRQRELIEKEIRRNINFEKIIFQKASATVSSNCGLGAFGLVYYM